MDPKNIAAIYVKEESFGGDGYVYGIDCGDRLKSICLSLNSSSCIQLFVCESHFNRIFFFF